MSQDPSTEIMRREHPDIKAASPRIREAFTVLVPGGMSTEVPAIQDWQLLVATEGYVAIDTRRVWQPTYHLSTGRALLVAPGQPFTLESVALDGSTVLFIRYASTGDFSPWRVRHFHHTRTDAGSIARGQAYAFRRQVLGPRRADGLSLSVCSVPRGTTPLRRKVQTPMIIQVISGCIVNSGPEPPAIMTPDGPDVLLTGDPLEFRCGPASSSPEALIIELT